MLNKPVFSVVIPVYNKLPHLERSVNSVLNQSYPFFELILIDDASTDGSSEKLTEFNDPRINVYTRSVPGPGGYAARNLGVTQAAGEWICFLDADDEWEADVLKSLADFIPKDPDVEVISWGWFLTTRSRRTLDKFSLLNKKYDFKYYALEDFLYGPQQVWTGAVSIKKELLLKSGLFPENKFKRGGDMDTWTRCLWHSKKNAWLNKTMSYYHIDSVNMVTKNIERDSLFIFSPFLLELFKQNNVRLRQAIMHYQNRYLYILLNGQVHQGEKIDYSMLKKMNITFQGLWLILKLHLNKIRLSVMSFKGMGNEVLKRKRIGSIG